MQIYVRYNSSISNLKVNIEACQLLKKTALKLKIFDLDNVGSNHRVNLNFVVPISSMYPQHPLLLFAFQHSRFVDQRKNELV